MMKVTILSDSNELVKKVLVSHSDVSFDYRLSPDADFQHAVVPIDKEFQIDGEIRSIEGLANEANIFQARYEDHLTNKINYIKEKSEELEKTAYNYINTALAVAGGLIAVYMFNRFTLKLSINDIVSYSTKQIGIISAFDTVVGAVAGGATYLFNYATKIPSDYAEKPIIKNIIDWAAKKSYVSQGSRLRDEVIKTNETLAQVGAAYSRHAKN